MKEMIRTSEENLKEEEVMWREGEKEVETEEEG